MKALHLTGLWGPLVAYALAIFVVSSTPNPPGADLAGDKLLHGSAYAVFGLLALRATHGGAGRWVWPRVIAAVALTVMYGLLDEMRQSLVPGRNASLADWAADSVGALIAALTFALWARLRPASQPTAGTGPNWPGARRGASRPSQREVDMQRRYAVVPGDGIGVDVTREAVKVLEAAASAASLKLVLEEFDCSAERYLKTGDAMPPGGLDTFRQYDGVFMGAFGDPRVPDMTHAREVLLGTRFQLDLYTNLRPVRCLHDRLCPLKGRSAADVDFVVFRENTEGLYVGVGGNFKKGTPDEIAIQEDVNTRKGVERIVRDAFEYARKHGRGKVTMSDKSNALRFGHDLWLRVFDELRAEYPDIESNHLYIDALAMQMIKNPAQFEVIVTCNMFGDIITDLGAQLQGGLGMAASGNIRPDGTSMFEPVHGSAPKYAGKDVANPFGAILTAAMMLEHTGLEQAARTIERAVEVCLEAGECTADVGGKLGTAATGDAVVRRMLDG